MAMIFTILNFLSRVKYNFFEDYADGSPSESHRMSEDRARRQKANPGGLGVRNINDCEARVLNKEGMKSPRRAVGDVFTLCGKGKTGKRALSGHGNGWPE